MLYMWTYVVDAVSETVWGTIDPTTDAYQEAANWTGVLYAIQAMGSVAWATMLPRFANTKLAYSVSLVFYLDIFTLDNARYLGQTSVSMPEIPAGGEYRVRLDSADLQNGIRFNVDWVVTDIR